MSGCLATVLFGVFVNKLGAASNPAMIGKILAGFCTVAYTGASAAFYMAGRHYTSITTDTKFSFFPKRNPPPAVAS